MDPADPVVGKVGLAESHQDAGLEVGGVDDQPGLSGRSWSVRRRTGGGVGLHQRSVMLRNGSQPGQHSESTSSVSAGHFADGAATLLEVVGTCRHRTQVAPAKPQDAGGDGSAGDARDPVEAGELPASLRRHRTPRWKSIAL